jgi:hypothetical protein
MCFVFWIAWQLYMHFSFAMMSLFRHIDNFRWKALKYSWSNFSCIIVTNVNLFVILERKLMFLLSDITSYILYFEPFFLKLIHWFFHWIRDFLFTSLIRKSIDTEIFSIFLNEWASLTCLSASSFSRMFWWDKIQLNCIINTSFFRYSTFLQMSFKMPFLSLLQMHCNADLLSTKTRTFDW